MTVLCLDYIYKLMPQPTNNNGGGPSDRKTVERTMSIGENFESNTKTMGKRPGKRPGRKPSKIDERAKLERSRQSARECRARKKLRYQYLEELVLNREKAVFALREELETCKQWCSQLGNGGPVPDALIKMIANEEMAQKKRQMEQSRRHLQSQQLQEQQSSVNLSWSSSSSSSSSSPPPLSQQRETYQGSSSQYQQHVPNIVASLQHDIQVQQGSQQGSQQLTHQLLALRQPSSGSAVLKRQMAFDMGQQLERPPVTETAPTVLTQGAPSPLMVQMSLGRQQQRPVSQIPQTSYHAQSAGFKTHQKGTLEHLGSRVRSEPPMVYGDSPQGDLFSGDLPSDLLDLAGPNLTARARSLSNPSTLVSQRRQPGFPNAVDTANPARTTSNPFGQLPSCQSVGLFSGSLVSEKMLPLPPIPTTITIDDSSSSDEHISETQLFRSTAPKRTLPDQLFADSSKRSRPQQQQPAPYLLSQNTDLSSSAAYDPQALLRNLTTVHCYSSTSTSNTPSPAGSLSPAPRHPGKSTPSSSTASSPAPLSSLSSMLDFPTSPLPFSTCSASSLPASHPPAVQCSSTGLSATISEPIPEWYSFLADLQDGGLSTLSARHGASSSHSTPLALTPKGVDQPATPDPTYMNVPNIIDEFLDSDEAL
ncbi:unnamed protein product [Lymnaea stagnalis]|uniref:BZIP domain-containing protein n=1 Tax=Lymnaea stagnalis TaxID=6523 RepID=A0AAV2HZZ4_LYMST